MHQCCNKKKYIKFKQLLFESDGRKIYCSKVNAIGLLATG